MLGSPHHLGPPAPPTLVLWSTGTAYFENQLVRTISVSEEGRAGVLKCSGLKHLFCSQTYGLGRSLLHLVWAGRLEAGPGVSAGRPLTRWLAGLGESNSWGPPSGAPQASLSLSVASARSRPAQRLRVTASLGSQGRLVRLDLRCLSVSLPPRPRATL